MSLLTVETALCVVIEQPQIDAVRAWADKAHPRWMPHINLIYPFVPAADFAALAPRLQSSLGRVEPFALRLNDIGAFPQRGGKAATLHIKADSPEMAQLFKTVVSALPLHVQAAAAQRPFAAHLTVAQFPLPQKGPQHRPPAHMHAVVASNPAQLAAAIRQELPLPLDVQVRHVALIARSGDEPFTVHYLAKLGSLQQEQPCRQQQRVPHPLVPASGLLDVRAEKAQADTDAAVLAAAVRRAAAWIAKMPRDKLPGSTSALLASLRPFCSVRVQLDPGQLLEELQQRRAVRRGPMAVVDREATAAAAVAANSNGGQGGGRGRGRGRGRGGGRGGGGSRPIRVFKSEPGVHIRCPPGAEDAQRKSPISNICFGDREAYSARVGAFLRHLWGTHRHTSGTVAMEERAFMRQLRQIAQVVAAVDGERVVQQLCAANIVDVHPDGRVSYSGKVDHL